MPLHPLTQPPGALQTGWKLVLKDDAPPPPAAAPADPAPAVPEDDLRADPRSAWELAEVR